MGCFVVFHKRVVFTGMKPLREFTSMEIMNPFCTSYTKRVKKLTKN